MTSWIVFTFLVLASLQLILWIARAPVVPFYDDSPDDPDDGLWNGWNVFLLSPDGPSDATEKEQIVNAN